MERIGFLILLMIAMVASNSGDLYIIVTEVTDVDILEVYTLKLNKNGNTELVTGNFKYLTGISETVDGISVFDQDKDIMDYTTDTDSTFIYSMDVYGKKLLPPISLGARSIIKMNYDTQTKRIIFTLVDSSDYLSMVSYSTVHGGYFSLNSLIAEFDVDMYVDGTLDVVRQNYYMIYANVSAFGIAKFSTSSVNAPITTTLLKCGVIDLVVNYIVYDPIRLTLFGVGSTFSPSLKYHLLTINPTNYKCTTAMIKTAEFGIATAYSYNPNTHLLYVGWAPNGAGKFYTVDVTTSIATGTTLSGGLVITDIEVEI